MLRVLRVIGVFLVSIGLIILTVPAQVALAATITVDDDGPADFSTIQDAVDFASSGDTITVMPGTYNEWVTVDKTLTIEGYDRDTTILQGAVTSPLSGIDIQNTTGVSISNLTIMEYRIGISLSNADNTSVTNTRIMDNRGTIITDYSAIETQDSDNNTFTSNIISNNEFGIFLRNGSDNNNIGGNTFTDNGRGIQLNSSSSNNLSNNSISSTSPGSTGIFIESNSNSNTITDNNSSNNAAHGLEITIGSSLNTVTGNTFSGNDMHGVFLIDNANGNEVADNEINSNGVWGVSIGLNCTANTISGNTISNNLERGIYLFQNVTFTKIYNNTISNNPEGLRLFAAHSAEVYNNNFINNTKQATAYSSGTSVFNLAAPTGGNFWSNWTSPDDDTDGFVDSPYIITLYYNLDNLPWTQQDGWTFNEPPVADAGSDQVVEADTLGGANVTLDGSASSDPNSDPLTYAWSWDGGTASGVNPTAFLPLGITTVTLIVNDGTVDSAPDTVEITVQDTTPPEITIDAPEERDHLRTESLVIDFEVTDVGSEVVYAATLDGDLVEDGDNIDLLLLALGSHTLTVNAEDSQGNANEAAVTFELVANTDSLLAAIGQMLSEGLIDNSGITNSLTSKVNAAIAKLDQGNDKAARNILKAFINQVRAQAGKYISAEAADILIADAEYVIDGLE